MAFDGYFPGGKPVAAPCGLLSVAEVIDHSARPEDEQWIQGYEYTDNGLATVRILPTDGSAPATELSNHLTSNLKHAVVPFTIEVEVKKTGRDLLTGDPFADIKDQIDAATQKAVERELWEGFSSQANEDNNMFFRRAEDGAEILTSGPVSPKKGIYLLEQAIGNSPLGGGGVLHMTRDVASSIAGVGLSYSDDKMDPAKGAIHTILGTPVVVGSGYTGNGPLGGTGTDATASNKWIYVTGPVTVHLGAIETVNQNFSQGFRPDVNDSNIKALRPVAVHFDSSIFYAVQITLPEMS